MYTAFFSSSSSYICMLCYIFGVCLLLELVLIIHYSCILSVYLSTCSRSRFCFHCFCIVVVVVGSCLFFYLTFSLRILCTPIWNCPCNNIQYVVFVYDAKRIYDVMWSVCVCFFSPYALWVCFIFIMFARIVVHLPSIAYI